MRPWDIYAVPARTPSAGQAKAPVPPLITIGLRWGRRFRLPGLLLAAMSGLYGQIPDGVRIDDPRVRVLVATEQPHKPSAMHEHGMNRVMIYLGDGEMKYTSKDGKVQTVKFKKGDVKWNP